MDLIGKTVVVRRSPSGVWLGKLEAYANRAATLSDARRAWSWEGAASCSGLAVRGPRTGKITEPVALAIIEDCCEILAITPEAIERWAAVPPWIVK